MWRQPWLATAEQIFEFNGLLGYFKPQGRLFLDLAKDDNFHPHTRAESDKPQCVQTTGLPRRKSRATIALLASVARWQMPMIEIENADRSTICLRAGGGRHSTVQDLACWGMGRRKRKKTTSHFFLLGGAGEREKKE